MLIVFKAAQLDAMPPTFENIAEGSYPVSRSLYFYVKKDNVNKVPGINEYLAGVHERTGEWARWLLGGKRDLYQ